MKNFYLKTIGTCLLIFISGMIHLSANNEITVLQQGITVSGTVTDRGEPLPGVNIVLKGTTQGQNSDANGKFSITVPNRETVLIFSYIGYTTQEIVVGNRTSIDVALIEDLRLIEEIVVVGYGTQRAKDVTSSVANVQMKNINDMPVSGIDHALTGQVAGVTVNLSSGIPGGGPQIQVRGLGAVGAGDQPLYVIDGFALPSPTNTNGQRERTNPINDISPQDIASITILKDASATAIYGSRGANGVVLITTHKGRSGKPKVQLNAYTGWQQVINNEKPNMMNGAEFAQFQKERYEDNGAPVPGIYQNPSQYGKGTNWFEEITRIAPVNEINLSVTGGTENLTSYVSVGYMNQEGVVLNTKFERFSIRANVNAKVSDKFNLGFTLNPNFTNRNRNVYGGDGRANEIGWAANASPIAPVYNSDGSYNPYINDGTGSAAWGYPNLIQSLKEIDQYTTGQRFIGTMYAEYEIIPGLQFKTAFNADWTGNNLTMYTPSTVRTVNGGGGLRVPSSRYNQWGYLNWASENTLVYQKDFDDHTITGLLGYSYQHQKDNSGDFTGTDYTSDEVQAMGAAARISGWSSNFQEWSLISQIIRATYGYKQKYLFMATLRRDASSRFGHDNRWGIFPSASAGWRLSEENFIQNIEWISDLKLRASYGLAGNFDIGNYTYMSQVTASNYVLNNALAGGRRMNTVGNPNLGWERVYEFNAGLDFGLFNDRIFLLVDYYRRNTKDLLLDVQIPASSGYSTAKENRGDLQNSGVEISLATRNIIRSDFSWTTNFNIAHNRNKVIALGRDNTTITSGFSGEQNPTHISIVGKPLAMFYGYRVEGIYRASDFENDGKPKSGVAAFPGAIPGNIKMKDVDGSGSITAVNDYEIIGNPYPDFVWGMSNVLIYKDLDLRVQMTGSVGGELMKTQYEYTRNIDGIFNVSRDVINRYRSESQPGDGRTPTTAGLAQGRVMYRDVNSDWIKNNDYLWVKNITLGYTLNKPVNFISSARFYLSVQNAFLITNYDGNPEVTNYGNTSESRKAGTLVPSVDYTTYPVPRTYSVGVNVSF